MNDPLTTARDIVRRYPQVNPDNKPSYYRYHRFRFAALLAAMLRLPGKQVLEVGVNPGHFTEMAHMAGYQVSGTDLFPEHRAELWQRLSVDVRRWNIDHEPPPYPPQSFDIILFSEVIEHLANPPLEALETFATLLKPGGHLIISTPNQFYVKSRLRTLFDIVLWRPFDHRDEFETWANLRSDARYYTHSRLFSMPQLAWMAERAGYSVVAREYHAAYEPVGLEWPRILKAPHRWLVKALIAAVTWVLPGTRSMILIVLKK
jgi:SAM-dependent methyltransferase